MQPLPQAERLERARRDEFARLQAEVYLLRLGINPDQPVLFHALMRYFRRMRPTEVERAERIDL